VFILEGEDQSLFDRVQEQNLNRQYELLTNCIEIGLMKGPVAFDKYFLWALNHVAVANISQFGGRFRREPIYVGHYKPPHFNEVDDWMDRFISTVQENWYIWTETELAAYGLWRLNWIHPFIEGNGRTARAACYYLLCVRSGSLLPGRKIVPERICERPRRIRAGSHSGRSSLGCWPFGLLGDGRLSRWTPTVSVGGRWLAL
jgi:hypothetical protein